MAGTNLSQSSCTYVTGPHQGQYIQGPFEQIQACKFLSAQLIDVMCLQTMSLRACVRACVCVKFYMLHTPHGFISTLQHGFCVSLHTLLELAWVPVPPSMSCCICIVKSSPW